MVEVLSLYNPIPAAEKKIFQQGIKTSSHEKGDYLLFDGDVQTDLFLVKSGVAALYVDMEKEAKYFDFAYNNRFCVDLHSFSNQTPSKYCIQCLEDCEIEQISFDDLQKIFDASSATERAFRMLTERILASLLEKCLVMETMSIKQRFEWVMQKRPELFRRIPHKFIASYVNIETTNFSKLYNQYCINNGLMWG